MNKKAIVFLAIIFINLVLLMQVQAYADLPEKGETTIIYYPTLSSEKIDDSTSSNEKANSSTPSNKIIIPDEVKDTANHILNKYVHFPKTNEEKTFLLMFLGAIVLIIFCIFRNTKNTKYKG